MQFITSLFGSSANAKFSALLFLLIVLFLVLVALAIVKWALVHFTGGPKPVGWEISRPYPLQFSGTGSLNAQIREIAIKNIGGLDAVGVVIALSEKPDALYSNHDLEEISVIGSDDAYFLKAANLNRGRTLQVRIGAIGKSPGELLRVYGEGFVGTKMNLQKKTLNLNLVLIPVFAALAFCLGVITAA